MENPLRISGICSESSTHSHGWFLGQGEARSHHPSSAWLYCTGSPSRHKSLSSPTLPQLNSQPRWTVNSFGLKQIYGRIAQAPSWPHNKHCPCQCVRPRSTTGHIRPLNHYCEISTPETPTSFIQRATSRAWKNFDQGAFHKDLEASVLCSSEYAWSSMFIDDLAETCLLHHAHVTH